MRLAAFIGGGIRGYASARALERIEDRLGGSAGPSLDLIAGTSTGAIIACGVADRIPASRIAELYRDHGPQIFPRGARWLWQRIRRSFRSGLSAPQYDAGPLCQALREIFGGLEFGQLRARTLITAYRVDAPGLVVLKSWHPTHARLRVADLCLASSAAPGFFPGCVLTDGGCGNPGAFIDGGLCANDPTLCAIAEAIRLGGQLSALQVLTIGCSAVPGAIPIRSVESMGFGEWATRLLPHSMHAQISAHRYYARQLLGPDQIARLEIPAPSPSLDDASAANLGALDGATLRWAQSAEGSADIDRALRLLR